MNLPPISCKKPDTIEDQATVLGLATSLPKHEQEIFVSIVEQLQQKCREWPAPTALAVAFMGTELSESN